MVLPRLGLKDYGFLPRNFLASFAGRGGHVCKYAVGIFRKGFSILMKGKCNWLLILSAFRCLEVQQPFCNHKATSLGIKKTH